MYSEWFYLPKLGAGVHRVKLALFTNDHRPYTSGGEAIASEVEISVQGGRALFGGGHIHP